jgi:hypothetical protein
MDGSALVWGSSAKHKPQRVGKVSSRLSLFELNLFKKKLPLLLPL